MEDAQSIIEDAFCSAEDALGIIEGAFWEMDGARSMVGGVLGIFGGGGRHEGLPSGVSAAGVDVDEALVGADAAAEESTSAEGA